MSILLKQSTATTLKVGPFLDSTNGNDNESGLTITQADVRLSKNGGNFAQKSDAGALTHDELGFYDCDLDATDTGTAGRLLVVIHEAGALIFWREYMVLPSNVFDSLTSTDKLQVDCREFGDSALDFTTTMKSSVNAEADTALTDYDPPTKAELDTGLGNLNDPTAASVADAVWDEARAGHVGAGSYGETMATVETNIDNIGAGGAGLDSIPWNSAWDAEVQSECNDALVALHLDHLLAVDYDPATKPGVATSLLNEIIENDGGVSRFTANSLEQAPTGGTNPNVLLSTTIATVNSQTEIVLTAGSDISQSYKDQAVVITDASNNDYPSVRKCSSYAGGSLTLTLDSAPDFTILAGDGVKVFATAPGTTAPTAADNADAVWDESLAAHLTGGSASQQLLSLKANVDSNL